MKPRHTTQTWKTNAFFTLADRLRPFDTALRQKRLLDVRSGDDVGFGFLLDWLRPERLVALDVEGPTSTSVSPPEPQPRIGYGASSSFDAVFLLARHDLKRTVRRLSLAEVERVLVPGGLLVVTTLDREPWATAEATWSHAVDRSAEAWNKLHVSLGGADFSILEEHLGNSRLLVARKAAVPHKSHAA